MDVRKGSTFENNERLRKSLLDLRKNITDRRVKERAIRDALLPMLKGNCLVYASIGDEVDTDETIARSLSDDNVRLYLPYTVENKIYPLRLLKIGKPDKRGNLPLDCYEKFDAETYVRPEIDMSVTPLLGFDGDGYRLGYGKGCYDRYFAVDKHIYKIGVAFDAQRCNFSHHALDVPLDCCITESGVIYFNHARYLG